MSVSSFTMDKVGAQKFRDAATVMGMQSEPMETQITQLLRSSTTIAVVGLSDNPLRPSFTTALYMQRQGYRIVPVNPTRSEILGERCYARLEDIDVAIDIVNVFRRSEEVLPVAQEAVRLAATHGVACFWQQLGIDNLEAAQWVSSHGLLSVSDRCIKIEHARLLGAR
jgi:uncharacterized protein